MNDLFCCIIIINRVYIIFFISDLLFESLTILLNSLVTLYRVVSEFNRVVNDSLEWLINLMLLLKFCVLNPTFPTIHLRREPSPLEEFNTL